MAENRSKTLQDKPGDKAWRLIKPIWKEISIYEGEDAFINDFKKVKLEVGLLFAVYWCRSEVGNGGFHQFFFNSTGVLAPEAVRGFRELELGKIANIVESAMIHFGVPYPRERRDRINLLPPLEDGCENPFSKLDDKFFALLKNDRFERAADRYAEVLSEG